MTLTMIMANSVSLPMESSTSSSLPPNARTVFSALFHGRGTRVTKQNVYDVEHEPTEREILQFARGDVQDMTLKSALAVSQWYYGLNSGRGSRLYRKLRPVDDDTDRIEICFFVNSIQ